MTRNLLAAVAGAMIGAGGLARGSHGERDEGNVRVLSERDVAETPTARTRA
jgi:hypothetical protein